MLPEFDDHGVLPPGLHSCSLTELVARFGRGSAEREVECKELGEFLDWCRAAGVQRVIVNGSFVTSKTVPIDVDIIILPSPDYPRDQKRLADSEFRWPFLHILVAAGEDDFVSVVETLFARHRREGEKGLIEVPL